MAILLVYGGPGIALAIAFLGYAIPILIRRGARGWRIVLVGFAGVAFPVWSLLLILSFGSRLPMMGPARFLAAIELVAVVGSVLLSAILWLVTRHKGTWLGPVVGCALFSAIALVAWMTSVRALEVVLSLCAVVAWHVSVGVGLTSWPGVSRDPTKCACGYPLVGLPRHATACPECGARVSVARLSPPTLPSSGQ